MWGSAAHVEECAAQQLGALFETYLNILARFIDSRHYGFHVDSQFLKSTFSTTLAKLGVSQRAQRLLLEKRIRGDELDKLAMAVLFNRTDMDASRLAQTATLGRSLLHHGVQRPASGLGSQSELRMIGNSR